MTTAEQHFARVVRALTDAGMSAAAAVRMGPTLDVTPASDDDAVVAAVSLLRTDLPALFGPTRQRDNGAVFGVGGLEEAKRRGFGPSTTDVCAVRHDDEPQWVDELRRRYGDEVADAAREKG